MRIHTTQSGFTLVELLVSLTLFTVVVTMTMGSLLVVIDANARAQNMQEVMTNLTFALDSMTREIRTGRSYYCINSLPGSLSESATRDCTQNTAFSFVEGGTSLTAGGDPRVAYRLNSARIERRLGTGSWVPITSETVTITTMQFTVTGSDTYQATGDVTPPSVVLYIEGHAGEIATTETSFQLQTTITKRILDI
ncbi:MAG: type II secretion system protein [Candidatus Paceibacterota bacterium]